MSERWEHVYQTTYARHDSGMVHVVHFLEHLGGRLAHEWLSQRTWAAWWDSRKGLHPIPHDARQFVARTHELCDVGAVVTDDDGTVIKVRLRPMAKVLRGPWMEKGTEK